MAAKAFFQINNITNCKFGFNMTRRDLKVLQIVKIREFFFFVEVFRTRTRIVLVFFNTLHRKRTLSRHKMTHESCAFLLISEVHGNHS